MRSEQNTSTIVSNPMPSDYLLVSEFAKLCGLTLRKILIYDQIGVLKPYRLNPVTKYREYKFEQVATGKEISLLRAMGFPYSVMKLRYSNPKKFRTLLQTHRDQLTLEIRTRELQVEIIDNALAR